MTRENIARAIAEAERFIHYARQLPEAETGVYDYHPKQQGAIRRASMDLTRTLAEMRKP